MDVRVGCAYDLSHGCGTPIRYHIDHRVWQLAEGQTVVLHARGPAKVSENQHRDGTAALGITSRALPTPRHHGQERQACSRQQSQECHDGTEQQRHGVRFGVDHLLKLQKKVCTSGVYGTAIVRVGVDARGCQYLMHSAQGAVTLWPFPLPSFYGHSSRLSDELTVPRSRTADWHPLTYSKLSVSQNPRLGVLT